MKLTPGDDFPLKLGARVPRIDEIRLPLVDCDYGGVLWVADKHTPALKSDMKHDAAPKPGGVPTKAAVKDAVKEAADALWHAEMKRIADATINADYPIPWSTNRA